jgi:5-methylcytosine-specific restriction protein B
MSNLKYYYAKLSCPKSDDSGSFLELFQKSKKHNYFTFTLSNIPNNLDNANNGDIIFIHIGGDSTNKRRYFNHNPEFIEYENGLHLIGKIDDIISIDKKVEVSIIGLKSIITKKDLYFFPQFINNLGASTKGTPNQAGLYELEEKVALGLIEYLYLRQAISKELIPLKDIDLTNNLYPYALEQFGSKFKEKKIISKFFSQISSPNKNNSIKSLIIKEFIKWFNLPENYKLSYKGIVNEVNLNFWNDTYFDKKLFKIDNQNIDKSIKEIKALVNNNVNSAWIDFNTSSSKGAPKAVLGDNNYIKFLKEFDFSQLSYEQIEFDIKNFQSKTKEAGLLFSETLIKRFIASLWTKPFVICSGLSGSGKTKLAQAFALWVCEDASQYEIVPVGADWTNREPLLGYPNALKDTGYVVPENGVLELILNAIENEHKPYFLILDEMNLSHVERYFADFLSTMESGDTIPLHKIKEDADCDIPQSLSLPKNLFIIGTVNIDETTYMFSPKVLDRANTIEFRLTNQDLEDFIDSDIPLNMDVLNPDGTGVGANIGEDFMMIASQPEINKLKDVKEELTSFFSELKKSGAEFGYRTTKEIGRLMYMLEELGEKSDHLLDIAIMQKMLPKLHGSRTKLSKTLPTLGEFCLNDPKDIKERYLDRYVANELSEDDIEKDDNIKFKVSFDKICRMYKNAIENGFASYAEA